MNQNYINLARKYRPQKITELIGQNALVTTLENAFKLNKIAHAFMLTGVRGVGKTTTARIIAKALNCIGEDGKGEQTLNPCGICEMCDSITLDRNIDVIEMDAASRTGVDDIREIIENARYKPVNARYKVFIIDEVHMLSKNAFNALLKTLEEPPSHLKFIFATTEIKKVPITVLSRCQRFDLRRVEINDLTNHLKNLAEKENITITPEGLTLIAKNANGSVRDSLSLFDQAIAYTNSDITEESILKMLGQGTKSDIYLLFEYLVQQDQTQAFISFNQQYNKGIEIENLILDLLDICHNISVFKTLNSSSSLKLPSIEIKEIEKIANITEMPSLIKIWQILLKSLEEIKINANHMQVFNMLMIKIITIGSFTNVDKIIASLETLEKKNLTSNPLDNKPILENIPTQNLTNTLSNPIPSSENNFSKGEASSNDYQEEKLSARDEIFLKKDYSKESNNLTKTKNIPEVSKENNKDSIEDIAPWEDTPEVDTQEALDSNTPTTILDIALNSSTQKEETNIDNNLNTLNNIETQEDIVKEVIKQVPNIKFKGND